MNWYETEKISIGCYYHDNDNNDNDINMYKSWKVKGKLYLVSYATGRLRWLEDRLMCSWQRCVAWRTHGLAPARCHSHVWCGRTTLAVSCTRCLENLLRVPLWFKNIRIMIFNIILIRLRWGRGMMRSVLTNREENFAIRDIKTMHDYLHVSALLKRVKAWRTRMAHLAPWGKHWKYQLMSCHW